MRLLVWTTSWWNSQAEFDLKYEGTELLKVDERTATQIFQYHPDYKGRFGLKSWFSNAIRWFPEQRYIVACGTWSDPDYSRFGRMVKIINSGALPNHPYTGSWNYAMCAFTGMMAYALNLNDWDLMVMLDGDVLFGALDWNSLLREFASRDTEVMGTDWHGRPGYLMAWKRSAAIRFLHQRLRPNLSETFSEGMELPEDELGRMYEGKLWNLWPDLVTVRQDYGHEAEKYINPQDTLTWPMIRLPHPSIIEQYEREQTALAKPFIKD